MTNSERILEIVKSALEAAGTAAEDTKALVEQMGEELAIEQLSALELQSVALDGLGDLRLL